MVLQNFPCLQCREGRHRLCHEPTPVVAITSLGPGSWREPGMIACCDDRVFWTRVVFVRSDHT